MALEFDEPAMRVLESNLSSPLTVDVKLTLFAGLILYAPFFENYRNLDVIMEVIVALDMTLWQPGDLVVRKGDTADAMYFVNRGKLDVLLNKAHPVIACKMTGECFGEVSLLQYGGLRTAYIRAAEYTHLSKLCRDTMEEIWDRHPDFRQYSIKTVGEMFRSSEMLEQMKKNPYLARLLTQVQHDEQNAKEEEFHASQEQETLESLLKERENGEVTDLAVEASTPITQVTDVDGTVLDQGTDQGPVPSSSPPVSENGDNLPVTKLLSHSAVNVTQDRQMSAGGPGFGRRSESFSAKGDIAHSGKTSIQAMGKFRARRSSNELRFRGSKDSSRCRDGGGSMDADTEVLVAKVSKKADLLVCCIADLEDRLLRLSENKQHDHIKLLHQAEANRRDLRVRSSSLRMVS